MSGFSSQSKQVTVVYSKGYESGANIIEAGIQAFSGYTSRLWDIDFYDANKATLSSDQFVLFLGGFDENAASKKYEKVFVNTEKVRGCVHAIAGSKALIYPTGEVADNTQELAGGVHFYTDSEGNTSSKSSSTFFEVQKLSGALLAQPKRSLATTMKFAAFGFLGNLLPDDLLTSSATIKQNQMEAGSEEFMQRRFAKWVGYAAD
ncbi:hypothetical protein QN412_21110 [Pseudomonas sp. RTB3]|uniref:hypothetical protein n=1 Tax=unclassified Pseudomonas TaxID=196821 RepID=UPI002B231361|nr:MULTISPECIES: hypothetical protein [unclassified Pseudomonas]MEB0007245.1 hypothetical protein [Pseudomonas sp. RTB2]MEB0019428.1 hypothetical protein [Pseudomonas sp. RTB3]MEB0270415.1 hypothetical protein [Pseudomonas sp. 5B4]